MQPVGSVADIARLGTILFVAAHPDDETFTAGGILAAAARGGQTVVCVTATAGEAGSQDETKWPCATLGAVRKRELAAALRHLGVTHHYQFSYGDGCCRQVPLTEAVDCLGAIIARHQPDTILTFGPDGLTGHPDHQAVSAWTTAARRSVGSSARLLHAVQVQKEYDAAWRLIDEKLNVFFNISQPPMVREMHCAVVFRLPPDIQDIKCCALQAMPSQTELLFRLLPPAVIDRALSCEFFVEASFNRK